jgi:tRNA U34 5-methylaminomethyl-2-thiouridine-forming methyltransferase MnmC
MYDEVFEVVTTRSGAKSIRHKELNETMHNPVGPWAEAHGLYVGPSRFKERLQQKESTGSWSAQPPLVLFDVGLGAATNAVAALHSQLDRRDVAACRTLEVVSFEKDLRLLAFTISHAEEFPYLTPYRDPLEALLERGQWQSPCGQACWRLHHGDFLETVKLEKTSPDVIFYDPYSPHVNEEMWSLDCFRLLFEQCKNKKSLLLTYSIATPIRAALLASGFYVGHGPRSGLKHETTQAATDPHLLNEPLGLRWIQRWERSHTKYPYGVPLEDFAALEKLLFQHPQFSFGLEHLALNKELPKKS